MKLALTLKEDGITQSLDAMLSRSRTVDAYLNRVVFRQYQEAQIKRWQTENASEGERWKPISPRYAKEKEILYSQYPGAGKALMVATGKLVNSAIGRDTSGFTKIVTTRGLQVALNLGYVPYAMRAAYDRPVMEFSSKTILDMHDGLARFLLKGEMR